MANAIDITVNATDRASGKIKGIGKAFEGLQSKAQKASGIITAIGAIGGVALTAIAVEGTKMNSTLEQSEARWTTLLKSSTKAEKQMAWMKNYSKTTPFDYEGIDKTATAMMGMGLSMKKVNKWLPALGDASAVLGGGTETVEGLGRALGQMNAKGKVSAEEMQQLAERGVDAWGMLADGMGMTQAEVRKLSEEGKLLAKDALPLIYKGMNKTFGGGTANLMKSTTGQAMEARESFSWLAQTLTQGAFNWFGANVLPLINKGLATLTTMFSGGLLQGFQKLWSSSTQAKIALMALAGIITGALIGAVILIGSAFAPAIVAFSGFVVAGMAVAGIVGTIIANWSTFAPFFTTLFNIVKTAVLGFKEAFLIAFQNLKAGITPLWESVKLLMISLKPVIELVGAVIGTLLVTAMAVFNGIVSAIAPVVTAFVNLMSFVTNVVMTIVNLLTGNWAGAMESWKKATKSATDFFKNIWQAIKNFFSSFVGTFISILKSFGVDVVAGFKNMWNKAKSAVSSGISAVLGFFKAMPSKVLSVITSLASSLVSKFTGMMSKAKSAVTKGVKNIISGVKNFGKTFLSAGKGLLSAFTDGIKKGIGKAKDAVANGMKKIREFLPFSPAKKGPLSDLDKSGGSFFPTFAQGMHKGLAPMLRMAQKGMGEVGNVLEQPQAQMDTLDNFTFGKQRQIVTMKLEVSGNVGVDGEKTNVGSQKVITEQVTGSVDDILSDFRRMVRSR